MSDDTTAIKRKFLTANLGYAKDDLGLLQVGLDNAIEKVTEFEVRVAEASARVEAMQELLEALDE